MREPKDYQPAWYRACTGESCQQGRSPCSTPEACRVAEEDEADDEDQFAFARGLVFAVLVTVALISTLAIMVWGA